MPNKTRGAQLYKPSAIPLILKIARERACQSERRSKKWLSEHLGITQKRLTNIEDGTAQAPLDLCLEWCDAVEDEVAKEQIQHIYGLGLPPTDPRLLESVPAELANFEKELDEAKKAADEIKGMSQRFRSWAGLPQRDAEQLQNDIARQILDIQHAAKCLLHAMKNEWNLNQTYVETDWINRAIHNGVIVHRVSDYEELMRERTDQERLKQLGVMK
ncbi:hypothetical protein [Thalassobacillus sp. C254]|uniref:hypothetical protein n=1 Tax=Thalassobacillus sp. C254 TaxID=1225341 RepID=UPI0006D1D940|nr:hypothetical protein [Thalassobacillus sp. C254]